MPAVTIRENTITNSDITIYTTKDLVELWEEQIESVREEIQNEISNDRIRRVILSELTETNRYVLEDLSILKSLLSQVNCDKKKSDAAHSLSIDRIIHFFIVSRLVDSYSSQPNHVTNKFSVEGKNNWLFNASKTSYMSLDTHIGAIADFIASHESCEISNGSIFICQLLSNGSLNCDRCQTGELNVQSKLSKILPNFFSNKRGVAINDESRKNDFFELQKQRNMQFRCGNCVTNIFDIDNATKILKD